MKHKGYGIIPIVFAALMTSCGGNTSGGKQHFAPQERVSSMTSEERELAIANKKAEMAALNYETLFNNDGIKFCIVQPHLQGEDITQDISDRVAVRLLEIACQNGISGMGTNPYFVFGTEITQTGRATTGTAPQKMVVKYQLTFKVMNTVTGDIYATAIQDVVGVGNSFIEANQNFAQEIKSTPSVQTMLKTASERIIAWYNTYLPTLKNEIESAVSQGKYDVALTLAMSVPQQAASAFEYVSARIPELTVGFKNQMASEMLSEMIATISSARDNFEPGIGAYLQLIPADSPQYAKAQEHYAAYLKQCDKRRLVLEAKAELDESAARELKKLEMEYAHANDIAEHETQRILARCNADVAAKEATAKANASASIARSQLELERKRTSLFGSIGYAISGTFDRLFTITDKTVMSKL